MLEGMSGVVIVVCLIWISGVMLVGFLFMGFFVMVLVYCGIKLEKVYFGVMVIVVSLLGLICVLLIFVGNLLWFLFGICFFLFNVLYLLVV